jgi:uncharacterized membrane protein SpoIIM required for sporulation/uncharacterized RDD family membrane protein YckC
MQQHDARDLVVDSVTGVELALPLAGPGARCYAFVIDWLIRAILFTAWYGMAALTYNGRWSVVAPVNPDAKWFVLVVTPAASLYFLYHLVLEVAMRGRTPGKRIAGVHIVARDGSPPSLGALLTRNVFRLVDSLPVGYGVGLLATLITSEHVRIGDMAAGTLLIHDRSDRTNRSGHRSPASSITAKGALATPDGEILADLLSRWPSLEAQARRRLAATLLSRHGITPSVSESDDAVRAMLEHLGPTVPSQTLSPADEALKVSLLQHSKLWETALARAERLSRERAPNLADAVQLADDYRMLAHDLTRVRRLMPNSRVREYLEGAYARAHNTLYRVAWRPGRAMLTLFRDEIPAVVHWLGPHIAWATTIFILTVLTGYWMVHTYPDLIGLFASPDLITTVEHGRLWTEGILNIVPSSVLSLQILTNNIVVSLFAYCAGFVFGLGTLYILGLNGLMLGAVFAFTSLHGLGRALFSFIVAHGCVELSVMCLSGAAGAAVGEALIRPATGTRIESFRIAALRSGKLLIACAVLLVGSGLIEGYISPRAHVPLWLRITIGVGYWLLMVAVLRGTFLRPGATGAAPRTGPTVSAPTTPAGPRSPQYPVAATANVARRSGLRAPAPRELSTDHSTRAPL